MTIADWLARTTADAESRGLSELVPLLQTLARSTEALRAADAEFEHPVTEYAGTEYTATKHADRTEHGQSGSRDDGRD